MTKIGVLDSGIGGLTTLSDIIKTVGGGEYLYFADTCNAPYGTKTAVEIRYAVTSAAYRLVKEGAELVVLACNTATAAAVEYLRREFSVPIVGMEPAIKPATKVGGRTLVLATPATVHSERFKRLHEGKHIVIAEARGLAERIEDVAPDFSALKGEFGRILDGKEYDNVVLGCTHYCYLRGIIGEMLPSARIFDGNTGVAERVASLVGRNLTEDAKIHILFSGREEKQSYYALLQSLLY